MMPDQKVKTKNSKEHIRSFLENPPVILKNFHQDDMTDLLECATLEKYGQDEVIITPGEDVNSGYLMVSGEATIWQENVQLSTLEEGDFMGETFLFSKNTHRAKVISVSESTLLRFDRIKVLSFFNKKPEKLFNIFTRNIIELQQVKIGSMNGQLFSPQVVEPLVKKLPSSAKGTHYHAKIGDLIEEMSQEKRLEMRSSLESYLQKMIENEASDLDLGGPGCNGKIWYRIHGDKVPADNGEAFTLEETDFLLHNLISPDQREQLMEDGSIDFSYTIDTDSKLDQRFRANMYLDLQHIALNMRRIDSTIRPFKGLKLHPKVAKVLSLKYFKYGLTLVTGITGSGKSSTLDTIIDANNRTVDSHIVIIASPVELIHHPIKSVVRHREVGRDVNSFKQGAIQALRQDPDIIVIGELRDPETIMTALEVTDSGHKTFGTLHTSSAMESVERILGEVPVNAQNRVRAHLADVLSCVISQKLVPSLDGKRALAKEVLLVTSSVKAAIRNDNLNEIYQMLMEGGKSGMNTMEQDLKRLYDEGKISEEVAMNNANNKKRMQQLLSNQI